MARPQYRVPGYPSERANNFVLETGVDQAGYDIWMKYMAEYESACILQEFDLAVLSFPFTVSDEKHITGLKNLHKYNRSRAAAELGEVLMEKACGDKNISAIQTLIEAMVTGAQVSGSANRLVLNFSK